MLHVTTVLAGNAHLTRSLPLTAVTAAGVVVIAPMPAASAELAAGAAPAMVEPAAADETARADCCCQSRRGDRMFSAASGVLECIKSCRCLTCFAVMFHCDC